MTDDEGWRRRRAEELRLVDDRLPVRLPSRPAVAGEEVAPMRPPRRPEPRPIGDAPDLAPPATAAVRAPAGGAPADHAAAAPPRHAYVMQGPRPARPGAAAAAAGPASPKRSRWLLAAVPAAMVAAAAVGWVARDWIEDSSVPPSPLLVAMADNAVPDTELAGMVATDTPPPPAPVFATQTPLADPGQRIDEATPPAPAKAAVEVEPPPVAARDADPVAPADLPPRAARWATPATPVALPGRSFKPSFNCRRAASTVTRMICADPTLASLDNEMSRSFYRVVGNADARTAERASEDQVDFLNRRARCRTNECIETLYRRRIDRLGDARL